MTLNGTVPVKRALVFASAFLLTSLIAGCAVSRLSNSEQDSHTLSVAAVGDTNGYNIGHAEGQLESMGALISSKDIFMFNAEGVFSENLHFKDCHRFRNQSLFLGSTEVLDSLPRGKITIASLANNHILDCGRKGLLETMQELKRHGIMTVGAGRNVDQACKPLRIDIKGRHIAVLAYLAMDPEVMAYVGMEPDWFSPDQGRAGVASWKLCNGQEEIAAIRKEVDIIIVMVHMHDSRFSWTEETSDAQNLFFRAILKAGADIVIGSGPHVSQGMIRSDRGLALFSLGNFLFNPDYNMPEQCRRSILADFTISNDVLRLTVVPLRLDIPGRPRVASDGDADLILRRIIYLSDKLGTKLQINGERAYLEIQSHPMAASFGTN